MALLDERGIEAVFGRDDADEPGMRTEGMVEQCEHRVCALISRIGSSSSEKIPSKWWNRKIRPRKSGKFPVPQAGKASTLTQYQPKEQIER